MRTDAALRRRWVGADGTTGAEPRARVVIPTLVRRDESRATLPAMGTEGHTSAVRVDQWVWAVRIFRTRALAAAACRAGHVHVNGRTARPATTVRVGDLVEARVEHRTFKLEVTRLIDKRVGPP